MSQNISSVSVEMEGKFDYLSNLTDQISLMNTDPVSNVDNAVEEMQKSIEELKGWKISNLSKQEKNYYLSHMSFHREIIADIISEARALLIEKYRGHLKVLVRYHREFCFWLAELERRYF